VGAVAFKKQAGFAGEADADDIATPGFVTEIGDPVDEIDLPGVIGRKHADAGDANGRGKNKIKNHEGANDEQAEPHQRPPGSASDYNGLDPSRKSDGTGLAAHIGLVPS